MEQRLIRLPEVMAMTGVKKSTIWKWISENKFPQRIKLSHRVSVWKLTDVNQWIEDQVEEAL